ncbi:MAG: hypothetical protein WCI72_06295 [archaeon]
MENETRQKTKEQALIEKEFPIEKRFGVNHCSMMDHISRNCARIATCSTEKNSRLEALAQRTSAAVKTVLTIGATALTAYLTNKIVDGDTRLLLPAIISATTNVCVLYRNIFGDHPVSGQYTYVASPYFSIFDNIELGNTWSKIAGLQKEGKLSQGKNEQLTTSDCYAELGRNFIGGP